MVLQTQALIIVAAYLIGMLLVGFIVGKLKIKDSSDYMLAGRRMGLFMVAFSLSANNIGGGSTTGLAQKAYGEWGMSAIWYVLTASIAMIPLAYFAPKIRKTMAVTIPEVVGRRFGKTSSTLTAVLSILSLFCLTLIPDCSLRHCSSQPDRNSYQCSSADRRRCSDSLYYLWRHDRRPDFRFGPVRHHTDRSCCCHPHRNPRMRRMGRHFCGSSSCFI